MVDVQAIIHEKEYKGQTTYSINPKKDINYGDSILVRKKNKEGKPFENKFNKDKPNYLCWVSINDVDASLWLTTKQHEEYKKLGGVDSLIRITRKENKFLNEKTGVKILYDDLDFELVEE